MLVVKDGLVRRAQLDLLWKTAGFREMRALLYLVLLAMSIVLHSFQGVLILHCPSVKSTNPGFHYISHILRLVGVL